MRDEQTNTREPMTCTWVRVTGPDGRRRMEARWLGDRVAATTPAPTPAIPPAAAHAA
jgi:hypothetical protein